MTTLDRPHGLGDAEVDASTGGLQLPSGSVMVPEIQKKLSMIADACRRYQVERLEVFGSASRGESAFRDVDLLVRFAQPNLPGYADRYMDLAEALERILERPVDLVTERSLRNPVLVRNVNRDRQTVFDAAA